MGAGVAPGCVPREPEELPRSVAIVQRCRRLLLLCRVSTLSSSLQYSRRCAFATRPNWSGRQYAPCRGLSRLVCGVTPVSVFQGLKYSQVHEGSSPDRSISVTVWCDVIWPCLNCQAPSIARLNIERTSLNSAAVAAPPRAATVQE